jgi:prepilin-type N-terminal cleavage/methylation domain-containing protein
MNRLQATLTSSHGAKRGGFTLIEIMIVVVLLAVLAAIVIPNFSDAASNSRKVALQEQLRRIRTDVQLYKMQHQDAPPALAGADWTDLTTQKANVAGIMCGPYMTTQPKNPLNNYSDVHVVNTDPAWGDAVPAPNIGFVYNSITGYIWGTNTSGGLVFNEDNLNDPNN